MRKLLLFMLLAVSAFAQNSRLDSVALGPRGPIPFAAVAVCTQPANTTTSPCSPLANLCSSLSDAVCTNPNPITADSLGNYHFYVKTSQGPVTVQLYGPQVAAPVALPDQSIPITATGFVKSLNNIQFADQFTGADCGAKINAADAALGATSGEIWLLNSCGTISSAITLNTNHTLKVFPGNYTLNAAITMNSGTAIHCSVFGMTGRGCVFTVNTAAQDGIDIAAGAVGGTIEGIGLDGSSRTNALGSAIKFLPGTSLSISNRWLVQNIHIVNWQGKGIELADWTQDNHFDNVFLGGVGNVTGSLPAIDIGADANANLFSNIMIDTPYYAGIREGSSAVGVGGGGVNNFVNIKIDTNTAPVGTINLIFTGAAGPLFDRFTNFIFRADRNGGGTGTCISITTAITDVSFDNGECYRLEAAGGTGLSVPASGAHIFVNNTTFKGFATGISDAGLGNENAYTNIGFLGNTTDFTFTNPQAITGVLSTGAPVARTFNLQIGNLIQANRAADNDLAFQTKATNLGIFHFQDAVGTDKATISAVDGSIISNGLAVPRVISSGTATMTTALIGANTCGTTVTVAATGVLTTDTIIWSYNASPANPPADLVVAQWPTAGNVNFEYCNPTAAGATPGAATLNWRVIR